MLAFVAAIAIAIVIAFVAAIAIVIAFVAAIAIGRHCGKCVHDDHDDIYNNDIDILLTIAVSDDRACDCIDVEDDDK